MMKDTVCIILESSFFVIKLDNTLQKIPDFDEL